MPIDRRALLTGAFAALALPSPAAAGRCARDELFAAAGKARDGSYAACLFGLERGTLARLPLPGRGHDAAVRPGARECVIFTRSPGTTAVALSADGERPPRWFSSPADRHFCGHGAFSKDGRLLFATENDYEAGRGAVGVWDASGGYHRIGAFPSQGLGPHDIALLPDGRTLVVANGGLRTHPVYGGEALNLASMAPSLSYIDIETGDVLETHGLAAELRQLSIRHLGVGVRDTVVFGCQHKGPRDERPALIGFHRRGELPQLLTLPRRIQRAMRNHVGSVRVDRAGEISAASSPRGGVVVFLDVAARRFLGEARLDEVCGIAARRSAPGFLFTNGQGRLATGRDAASFEASPATPAGFIAAWDNHIAAL